VIDRYPVTTIAEAASAISTNNAYRKPRIAEKVMLTFSTACPTDPNAIVTQRNATASVPENMPDLTKLEQK
jgi:hypothetical protein